MSTTSRLGTKILIVGSPGAGKSTLGRLLSKALHIDHLELDDYYWLPNWGAHEPEAWQQVLGDLLSRPSWIVDGNYLSSLQMRQNAADTVIFLDMPQSLCLFRVLLRAAKRACGRRDDLPLAIRANPQTKTAHQFLSFLKFVATFSRKQKPLVQGILQCHSNVILIRNSQDLAQLSQLLDKKGAST